MIKITRDEASYIRLHNIDLDISMTGRGKRKKKYYAPEAGVIFKLLKDFNKTLNIKEIREND